MDILDFAGQTLDGKYLMTHELGRGGMGTVYLASHLGTERPVAVKIIAPQYMQRVEFVERFRREARAAGRLRHPNVVNVTDFGFSETKNGRVAYLVMEYLDGCTLGEILDEEKNLPVSWTLDILEQVCSAVHEAHGQGIIHRDLKPDNIWLEPNQRGGYTVKVLDFGIAKLEENNGSEAGEIQMSASSAATFVSVPNATVAEKPDDRTIHDNVSQTRIVDGPAADGNIYGTQALESKTLIQPIAPGNEDRTSMISLHQSDTDDQDGVGTRILPDQTNLGETSEPAGTDDGPLIDAPTNSNLTRVGAVLGTPLYMSPEQCRGDRLDARSDIYSLGIIAYQMLSGDTPFRGDFTKVMAAHREIPPPPLKAKKVRKKLKQVIGTALAKDPNDRPQTAEAFASRLTARSEGIFGLIRRAATIYFAHLPKFLGITVLFYIPFVIATLLNVVVSIMYFGPDADSTSATIWKFSLTAITMFTAFFGGYLIVGTTTWLVNQILALPLRPVRVRPALTATKNIWKRLIGTGILSTLVTFLGLLLCVIPGLVSFVLLALVSPVVMMENFKGIAALKRSKDLVMRSLRTTAAAVAILFFVPVIVGGTVGFVVAVSVKAFSADTEKSKTAADSSTTISTSGQSNQDMASAGTSADESVRYSINSGGPVKFEEADESDKSAASIRGLIRESLTALLSLPIQILLTSLSAIIVALLYLNTRQAGGESLHDLLSKFEDAEQPRKRWQKRVRNRLIQSGRRTSKSL